MCSGDRSVSGSTLSEDPLPAPGPPADERHRQQAANRAFLVYFAGTALLLFVVLRPFVTTLIVAAVVSVWTTPVHQWLLRRWPHPRILSVLVTTGVVVLVLLPLALIFATAVGQLQDVAAEASVFVADPTSIPGAQVLLDMLGRVWDIPPTEVPARIEGLFRSGATRMFTLLSQSAKDIFAATATAGLHLIIFLFSLFTFLIWGDRILTRFKILSPLDDELEEKLIRIFRGFSQGIALGGFVTAILQGAVSGIGYEIAGIEESFFWGTVTAMFSFVPVVGTALVWVPLTISLLLQGETSMALFLVIYNAVVTGGVDNLVRPWLIGQSSTLHPLLLFLSIFGGLMSLGFAGILIGPVACAFFLALAEAYESSLMQNVPSASTGETDAGRGGSSTGAVGPGSSDPL